MQMLFMMILMFGLFYFMLIRPQQRKENERRQMIESLRAGTKIIFAGGLIGEITEAREKTFVVKMTDGSVEIVRDCVQGVVGAEEAAK